MAGKNPWAGLSQKERQRRIDKAKQTRQRTALALVEPEHLPITSIPARHVEQQQASSLDTLAALIVAVWQRL